MVKCKTDDLERLVTQTSISHLMNEANTAGIKDRYQDKLQVIVVYLFDKILLALILKRNLKFCFI